MSKLSSMTSVASVLAMTLTGASLTACAVPTKYGAPMAASEQKAADARCGAAKPDGAHKMADGRCGAAKPADGHKMADGSCGEGKCGAAK